MKKNKIYNLDCICGLKKMKDNVIDLTVTSCPYNITPKKGIKSGKILYTTYDDNLIYENYISWLTLVFQELYNKTKIGGRLCLNISDAQNGRIPTHVHLNDALEKMGWINITTIIWNKSQVSRRTSWGSFNSPSCPAFPMNFEYIIVLAKDQRKLSYRGETDLDKQEFIDWTLPIWSFYPETRQGKLPLKAMFPYELPYRCIKMFSWKDALVCDPFLGLGTTVKVAKDLGRNFIGFEISKEYFDIANKRITANSDKLSEWI